MRLLFKVVLIGLLMFNGASYGLEPTTPNLNDEIRQAARLSLAQGVAWLKQRSETDPDGWIVGPVRVNAIIGTTNMMLRHSKKLIWKPEFATTNVTILVQDTVGAPLRKVVQSRTGKQIGSNEVERLVLDSKGTILLEKPVPLFDKNRDTDWPARGIGDAALTAYALQKAGVPDSDPVLQKLLSNLKDHITTLGLPDQTWNQAWLTVVFAGAPGEEAKELTQRLASRLLDGQIQEGEARGFWGTLSVHHELLAVMLRDYLIMMSDLQKKEALLKEKSAKTGPGGKMTQATKTAQTAVDELREAMDRYKWLTESEVCQRGFRLSNVENNWIVDPNASPKIMLSGADHMLYNQIVADMESTQIALFALSIAAEKGRLPAESRRPKLTRKAGIPSSSFPLPERSESVLARSANALAAQQAKDGRWSECNKHQPMTKFDEFTGTLPVPVELKSFLPLSSPITSLSTVQGFTALDSIGRIPGMNRLFTPFKTSYLAGASASRKELETRLATVWPKPTVRPQFMREDYDLLLVLSHLRSCTTNTSAETPDTDQLVRAVVLAANPTGSWGKSLYTWTLPSSSKARREVLKETSRELNKAHIIPAHATFTPHSPLARNAEGVSTAIAVIFLASRMENPAAVLEEFDSNSDLAPLREQAVKKLQIRKPQKPESRTLPHTAE